MDKKILVLGATGAMGVYLVPELLEMGYAVDAVALDTAPTDHPKLRRFQADAFDMAFLKERMEEHYDAIVDFLIYPEPEKYLPYRNLFLAHTAHYLFLSTYRVYAGAQPITESAPRLIDVPMGDDFVYEREYSVYKAIEEDMLHGSGKNNWTILRPAITYSKRRYQLTILEASVLVPRMQAGKTVYLPDIALDHQATMSWAGDVAKMIARLVLNPKAFGETYTVSTAEHHTWREIAQMYEKIGGLRWQTVDVDTFVNFWDGNDPRRRIQLVYDRCFDRIVDNRKVLAATGMTQSELMPLEKGLALEYGRLDPAHIKPSKTVNESMDAYMRGETV